MISKHVIEPIYIYANENTAVQTGGGGHKKGKEG